MSLKAFSFLVFLLFFTCFLFAQNEDIMALQLKEYELSSHKKFQQKLYDFSDEYIQKQSKSFVDQETGFFTLWSEAFKYFQSDVKKEARWKSRIDKHFRVTDYIEAIHENERNYAAVINQQREELLNNLHSSKNKLILQNRNPIEFASSKDIVNETMVDINKLVLTEIVPEALGILISIILIPVLALFVVGFEQIISGILLVCIIIFAIWKSITFSNRLEQRLNDTFELMSKEDLEIEPLLVENTELYYSELFKHM